jgi:hypothetical protein
MSSYATDNPQTMSGIGGARDYSQYYLPQNMGIDSPPPDAPIDSQYLTDEAGLRADISGQYQDELGYLGYTDDQGNYIPGSLLTDAQINEAQYEQQRQLAIKQNTQNAQQQGTLFSGIRAQQQAEAESPYIQSIAGIEQRLPVDMASHYEKAAGLISSYNNQQSALLASAAARAAAAASANPPVDTTPPATTTPPSSTPPADTTPPPPDNTFEGIPTGPNGTYSTLPYRSGTQPFIAMASGGEVDSPTPALIGEKGPEAVVPLSGLHPHEQDIVHGLIAAARSRMSGQTDAGGMIRNPGPGIHWFGPGGSGVSYPQPRPVDPPFGPPPGRTDTIPQVYPPGIVEGLPPQYPADHVSSEQWMAHHPGVMSGKVGTGYVPNWARAAVNLRLHPPKPVIHGFGPGGAVTWPPVGIPDPGITPAGGFRY